MKRDKRIVGMFDKDKIKVAVDEATQEILANPDWYMLDPNSGEVETHMLDTLAPDWLGTHQAKEIIDQFGLRLKNDEFAWDEIDNTFDNVAILLNKAINLTHPKFDSLWLEFGHGEGSPDWGLMLLFEIKEVKE